MAHVISQFEGDDRLNGVLLFISAWNDYFWPLLVTNKRNFQLCRSVFNLSCQRKRINGADDGGNTMASLPILVIYLALQRHIIDSFLKGGLR